MKILSRALFPLIVLCAIQLRAVGHATAAAPRVDALRAEFATLMDVPYTTAIAAAQHTELIAWVQRRSGRMELYVGSAPHYHSRLLTAISGDTGDEIGNLAVSPDGRFVTYTRGPSAAPNGRTPNPASLTEGLRNALWLVASAGGEPRNLGAHASQPVFSPDGRRLIFSVADSLQMVELPLVLSAGADLQPHLLFVDRGSIGDVAWSPRGDAIAFVSYRSTHSFVGVYELGADRVRWIAPSIGQDMSVAWSPEGRRLAFMRLPGRSDTDVRDVLEPSPFRLYVADAASGVAEEIYRSTNASASTQTELPLQWLKDGRVAFLSDADGYSQLYGVAPETRVVTQLTHGRCDFETFAVDEARETVLLSGNCRDWARREVDLWSDSSSRLMPVSAEGTVATDPVFVGRTGAIAWRSATFKRAQTPLLRSVHGQTRLLEVEPGIEDPQFQDTSVVSFAAADGTPLTGVLFKARGIPQGARTAAVVYVHGGPVRQMMPAWHPSLYYAYAYAANQQLALHGVTVLAVNYRTGVGFGRAFRSPPGTGPKGLAELQDIIAAGDYLRSRGDVDGNRIGIFGGSYGGHLTANALGRRSDLFRVGVAWHGIYDFTQWITNVGHPNRLSSPWGASEAQRDLAFQSSALSTVRTWRSPTLFICGDDDRNVEFEETITMVRALEAAGVPVETLVLPNEIHGFLRHASWLDVISHTNAYLLDHLER